MSRSLKLVLSSAVALTTKAFMTPSVVRPTVSRMMTLSAAFSHDLKAEWTTPKVEGDTVPAVDFLTRVRIESDDENPFDWKTMTTDDLFKGKRVVVFSLPGAFTPTCSSTHVPGYEAAYDEIKALGIDDVYCTLRLTTGTNRRQRQIYWVVCDALDDVGFSVNDAFVMRQWGLKQGLEEDKTIGSLGFAKVKMIPDGAAHFTRGMGMSNVWESNRGFGERSWRYSMVVKDGVIEKMFEEPGRVYNSGPDPFEVTDANTMIAYLKEVA